jgi:hypothetical protein
MQASQSILNNYNISPNHIYTTDGGKKSQCYHHLYEQLMLVSTVFIFVCDTLCVCVCVGVCALCGHLCGAVFPGTPVLLN